MGASKPEIIEEINGLLGDCLSGYSERALRRLTIAELYRIYEELRGLSPYVELSIEGD